MKLAMKGFTLLDRPAASTRPVAKWRHRHRHNTARCILKFMMEVCNLNFQQSKLKYAFRLQLGP